MKLLSNLTAFLFTGMLTTTVFAQSSTELVFKNPTRIAGTDKKVGTSYRFYNVTNGTDAIMTIAAASEENLINNLDVTEHGWAKAFQPEIGKPGNVSKNQNWWVRFNLKFVHAGTTTKKKLPKFHATAIDVDGDGSSVQEYIQMYTADTVQYRSVSQLTSKTPFSASLVPNEKTNYSLGPVQNYTNIDTAATKVMVSYVFMNTDEINFVYGATVGTTTSSAAMRLNSLWFKSFDLNLQATLAVKTASFLLTNDRQNVNLQWSVASNEALSQTIVERSVDGVAFEPIAQLPASASKLSFGYTDINVASATGIVYYRLLFKEVTGEISYSEIKTARIGKISNEALTVYPNPVVGLANVTFPLAWQKKTVRLAVFNAAGIHLQTHYISQASQTEAFNFSTLGKGLYIIKAQCEERILEQRIVKK